MVEKKNCWKLHHLRFRLLFTDDFAQFAYIFLPRLLKDIDDGVDSTHSMFSNTIGKIAKLGKLPTIRQFTIDNRH